MFSVRVLIHRSSGASETTSIYIRLGSVRLSVSVT
jgi:hypothetical protein